MARFAFRLATLLKAREAARDERRLQLAKAHEADRVLAEEQERLMHSLRQLAEQSRAASSPGVIDVDRLLEAGRHEMVLKAQAQHVQQQRQAVAAEIDRRRAALAEADRQVKVLDKLRERQLQRHREEENRRETLRLDEVAQQRVVREVQ